MTATALPEIRSVGAPPEMHANRIVAEMLRYLAQEHAELWNVIHAITRDPLARDGNPRAQAYAAIDFLSLAGAGSAFPGQITRIYWHQFDSAAGHPTGWDSGLVAPGDRYERASYCVLAGDSVAQALADPACNRTAAAEDSEDSARGYPEADGVRAGDPPRDPCPQPWCAFSLLRLRLTGLGR